VCIPESVIASRPSQAVRKAKKLVCTDVHLFIHLLPTLKLVVVMFSLYMSV